MDDGRGSQVPTIVWRPPHHTWYPRRWCKATHRREDDGCHSLITALMYRHLPEGGPWPWLASTHPFSTAATWYPCRSCKVTHQSEDDGCSSQPPSHLILLTPVIPFSWLVILFCWLGSPYFIDYCHISLTPVIRFSWLIILLYWLESFYFINLSHSILLTRVIPFYLLESLYLIGMRHQILLTPVILFYWLESFHVIESSFLVIAPSHSVLLTRVIRFY